MWNLRGEGFGFWGLLEVLLGIRRGDGRIDPLVFAFWEELKMKVFYSLLGLLQEELEIVIKSNYKFLLKIHYIS